ncbi:MAG TPA: DUF2341 domain-containing protein [Methanosarcina sp.]|jgi:hypothetical protein|nr:DUF2341 domain-containing protein [Methanosarcina sp.]
MAKRSTVYGIITIFFIFLLAGCALATEDDTQALSTKGDSWSCSQEILVTENAGKTLQGYSVPVSLDSSNFNFSESKSDGSDIRFSLDNRTLNYWIETWDPENEKALIWVRLPYLPANKTTKILMRYANPGAKAMSSGKKTFDFFDNFEGSGLNYFNWNAKNTRGGLVEVKNGVCNVAVPKAYDSSIIYSKASFDINSMFVVKRMKVTTGADDRGPVLQQGFMDQIDNRNNEIKHETEFANESRMGLETTYRKEKSTFLDLTDANVPEGEWYISGIAWYEENGARKVSWFKNGIQDPKMDFVSNDFITDFPMHTYLYAASYQDASDNTGYMAVDYVLVRKFVGIEPAVKVISALGDNKVSSDSASENNSENNTENIFESGVDSESGVLSEPQVALESEQNSKADTPEGGSQAQENLNQNETGASGALFPEYNVGLSGIRLSPPPESNFSALIKELNVSGIDTIFLSIRSENVWQYERFVKTVHEEGISVYALILEGVNCTERGAGNTCLDSLDAALDYNEKSLAPFDGVAIYVNSFGEEGSEESTIDYRTLFETANKEVKGNVSISASLPLDYNASQIEEIAPFVDSFIIRAYPGKNEKFNTIPGIVDAVALEMGEIRGAGSKGILEISVGEGFKNKVSIQELFADLVNYYSGDSAFLGVSISDYDAYKALPVEEESNEKKSPIPGYKALPILLAGLGILALLRMKGNEIKKKLNGIRKKEQ